MQNESKITMNDGATQMQAGCGKLKQTSSYEQLKGYKMQKTEHRLQTSNEAPLQLTSAFSVRVVSSISEPCAISVRRWRLKQQRWFPAPLLAQGFTTASRCLLLAYQTRTLIS